MFGSVVRSLGHGGEWLSRWARTLCPTDDERRLRAIFGEPVLTPGEAIWFAWTRHIFPDHRLLTPAEAAEFSRLSRDEIRRGIDAGLLPGLQLADEREGRLDSCVTGNGQPSFADEQPIGARPVV